MGKKGFDYYVFVDYSVDLIGYIVVGSDRVDDCLHEFSKFKHYNVLKQKSSYRDFVRGLLGRINLSDYLERWKLVGKRFKVELFSEILEFCVRRDWARVFISVDDAHYSDFMKCFNLGGERFRIVREGTLRKSSLKRSSPEYRLSLIIDTLLNLKRMKN